MRDTFNLAAMHDELVRDEGRRHLPYHDTAARLSIGIGRNLTDKGITDAEIDFMFEHDLSDAADDLDRNIAWWRSLDAVRQRVMLNMTYNMGWPSFSMFARFFSAMRQSRWDDAAIEMISSRWATQVGDRAKRLEQMVRTGVAV